MSVDNAIMSYLDARAEQRERPTDERRVNAVQDAWHALCQAAGGGLAAWDLFDAHPHLRPGCH